MFPQILLQQFTSEQYKRMNNQKPASGEAKQAGDQETSDLSQPIDLAQRVALSSLPSGHSSQSVAPQPVAMRAHLDPSKSALMTLYLRAPVAPRSSGPSSAQVVGPPTVMTASMASAQHFSSKTVVRLPTTDNSQSHAGVAATGSSTHLATATISTPLSQPSSSGTARHISSTTVHPLSASSGASSGAMASIIKGAHSVTQTVAGHMIHSIHQPYSSHVPRGPAAVANISAAPKSAVATPMLRPSHSAASATLPPSSIITSHPQMTPRSPSVVPGRTATTTPPVPKAASPVVTMTQIIDLQKNTSYVTSSGQGQVALSSRPVEVSLRTTLPHSSVTLNKPIHVSQPIVQHLQQVPEKGFIKTVVTSSSSSPHPHNSLSNQAPPAITSSGSELASHSTSVTTTTSVPCTSTHTSVVTLASGTQRVPLNQPPSLQTVSHSFPVTTSASVALHPTFTVVSAKGLSQTVHTVAPVAQQYSQAVTIAASPARAAAPVHVSSLVVTTVATPVTTTSVTCIATVAAVSRPLNTTVSSASIPVAKVYPQPLPTTSHSSLDSSAENSRGNFYVAQPQGPATSTVTVSTNVASMPSTVVLSENRNESGSSPVQFATIPKTGVPSGTPYAVSPAAYYYEPYSVQSAITMHPYTASPSAQGFTAAMPSTTSLRSGILPQHTSGGLSNQSHATIATPPAASPVAPVRPLNSVMVAVDTSRHVALHSTFTSASGGKSNTEVVVPQSSAPPPTLYTVASNGNANVGLGATSLVSTAYNSPQQGPVSNHNTSPRPSILRKRTSDGVTAAAKKNLLASLPSSGPTSPHPDPPAPTTATSPKPQSDQIRENSGFGSTQSTELVDPNRISSHVTVTVKQEPTDASENGSTTNSNVVNQVLTPVVQVEASPRKKPRKQLLAANELIEAHSTDGEDDFDKEIKDIKKELQKEDEESVKWVTFCKRPAMSLLNSYRHTWKSRHNHFLRYTDVKPKEEKRPTVNDLANQKGVLQKANGWKIYHLASQMDDVIDLEDTVCSRLSHLLEFVENDPPAWRKKPLNSDEDKILGKLTDLIKGNLQRSKIVQDQVAESKQQVLKVLEHKPHIMEIVSKYVSKRPLKKKEKS